MAGPQKAFDRWAAKLYENEEPFFTPFAFFRWRDYRVLGERKSGRKKIGNCADARSAGCSCHPRGTTLARVVRQSNLDQVLFTPDIRDI